MEKLIKFYKKDFSRFATQKEKIRRLWNIDAETGKFIYQQIINFHPKHILEIGTSNGYSGFWISLAAEKSNSKFITIEVDVTRQNMAFENCCIGRGLACFRYKYNKSFYTSMDFFYSQDL